MVTERVRQTVFVFVDGEGVERYVRTYSMRDAQAMAAAFVTKQTGSQAAGQVAKTTVREEGS